MYCTYAVPHLEGTRATSGTRAARWPWLL